MAFSGGATRGAFVSCDSREGESFPVVTQFALDSHSRSRKPGKRNASVSSGIRSSEKRCEGKTRGKKWVRPFQSRDVHFNNFVSYHTCCSSIFRFESENALSNPNFRAIIYIDYLMPQLSVEYVHSTDTAIKVLEIVSSTQVHAPLSRYGASVNSVKERYTTEKGKPLLFNPICTLHAFSTPS